MNYNPTTLLPEELDLQEHLDGGFECFINGDFKKLERVSSVVNGGKMIKPNEFLATVLKRGNLIHYLIAEYIFKKIGNGWIDTFRDEKVHNLYDYQDYQDQIDFGIKTLDYYFSRGFEVAFFKEKPLCEQRLVYTNWVDIIYTGTFDVVLVNHSKKILLLLDWKSSYPKEMHQAFLDKSVFNKEEYMNKKSKYFNIYKKYIDHDKPSLLYTQMLRGMNEYKNYDIKTGYVYLFFEKIYERAISSCENDIRHFFKLLPIEELEELKIGKYGF